MNKMITYTTLGELIRHHRKQAEMTLVQLAEAAKLTKGNLSKIESGQIKCPSYQTILKINSVLNLPLKEVIERYIGIVDKTDSLFDILDDISHNEKNIPIIEKVAIKALKSPKNDSIELVERLFQKVEGIKSSSIKLTLLKSITRFSKTHGIMPYIAKCLLKIYLIERDDFTKLRSTYDSGKVIVMEYEEFLTSEERGEMYYSFGVHAYNLYLFEESIEMCKKALNETISDRMRANTIGAVSNSYYRLGDYKRTKKYLDQYKTFSFPEVKDNVKEIEAMLHSAHGNYQQAISLLEENLPHCGDFTLLHIVNHLIRLYLQTNNLPKIQELIELEEKLLSIPCVTPFKKSELALYFRLKGEYYILIKRVEEGINYCLESAKRYANIDLVNKEKESLSIIMNTQVINKEFMASLTIEKVGNYYKKFII
ncbi:helix-turn-helix domain-containing protein [Chengkuizengella marina]|uniref:XRE family transcriptional regulator n=1 Tax=Chengkuizengella marina TaxID=2507566 RepID=A0A6N9Q8F3_9BACL|nr:helix-turn-helix transcriptional regulator [Chengkuizengella marina]NBI31099.1 XRE family transcriptional regulator [Chengkuizengella marina]